ncbi:BLUF domain-containing protein [Simiduia litorea]|uniref:BLUF domain-containing protein n=1 Tax=Simiduia litorea TaxID=1435348 RepID=UPI0036F248E4
MGAGFGACQLLGVQLYLMPRLLMYSSEINHRLLDVEDSLFECLSDIQKKSQVCNIVLGVNGVLVVDSGRFVQILEGEHDEIEYLLKKIMSDPRHDNLQILIDEPVRSASFTSWNMEVFILDDQESIPVTVLENFRDAYLRNEKPNGRELGQWVKRLMTHPDIRFSNKE